MHQNLGMDGHIVRNLQSMLCFYLIILLGEIFGGRTLNFVGLPGTGTVPEHSPAGTVVYTFSVNLSPSDPSVVVGLPVIRNSNPLTKAFDINYENPTYKVVTTGNPSLDYETMPHRFALEIFVEDGAWANDLQILTVEVLDVNEPPVFQGNMAQQTVIIYILENSPEGNIYQIHATNYENVTSRELKYSLAPLSEPFFVSSTGTITSRKKFDYEKDLPSYMLNITVTDHLGLSTTRTVMINIININDEPPYFTTTETAFRIKEESATGTFVARIEAKDSDDGEGYISSLRYSISNPNPNFYINPVTGVIEVAGRIDRDASPFKEQPNICLVICVVDSPNGGRSNNLTICITIEDINDNLPECDSYNFRTEIPETETTGVSIINLQIHCHDYDAESPNNVFNFTELSGVGSNKFTQVPPGSGIITLIGNLDRENSTDGAMEDVYTLNTAVQHIGPPYHSNNIYVYVRILPVNEFKPVFTSSSYVFNVSEIVQVSYNVGQVSATDKDIPPTGISYSIVAGGGTHCCSDIFWIDPKEGIVKTLARLDYETQRSYTLTVQASDNESQSTNVFVTVNVLEANDEKPVCTPNSYLLEISMPLAVGTNIDGFSIECTDRDSSPRSFRYTICSGNVDNLFTFSPSAGSNVSRLILATPFDYERGRDRVWNYILNVCISDDNLLLTADRTSVLSQTGTVTLTIRILPNPTTVAPTTPGITVVTSRENVYFASAWYVPFIICLGSLLLLGLLGYLTYLLAKYIRTHCLPKPKADKNPLIKVPEKKKVKKEVVWEMTNINTIFDGEARDPVTGKLYEFNSKSGARRWKDTNVPQHSDTKIPVAQETTATARSIEQGNLSKKETEASGRNLGGQENTAPKPSKEKTEVSGHDSNLKLQKPKEEPLGKGSSLPAPPHISPAPSPKIYPKYHQSQSSKNEV